MKIKTDDFSDLALALRPILQIHDIPQELHDSLVADLLFSFASFLDQKTGSNHHEKIFALLDEHAEALMGEERQADGLLSEVRIVFKKGRRVELNILRSHLDNKPHLMFDLEMALGIRGIDEIDARIDAEARFAALMSKKDGIRSVDFMGGRQGGRPQWLSMPLLGSDAGDFGQSLDGLHQCITTIARRWA